MILEFSGGKDSLVVLHKFRDQIKTVIFADTGSVFPHCVDFVKRTCEKYELPLVIVRSPVNVLDWTDERGLPSDTYIHKAPNPNMNLGLQRPEECCGEMIWKPMQNYLISIGAGTVLRGQKASDHHVSLGAEFFFGSICYVNPLWEWTDQDVFNYINEHDLEIAEHYNEINESLDCWNCTAHLSHKGASKRLSYTKKRYPELWEKLSKKLSFVKRTLLREQEIQNESFDMVPLYDSVKQHQEWRSMEKTHGY